MKKIFVLCIFSLLVHAAFAADTTKITSHNKVVIKTNPARGITEYPARVGFPDTGVQSRKIYMYLEFGCAPGLKCGEWDYGNHIYLEKDSVRYEIARFITPYGFYWNSSMNWKHGWYYDLTDYAHLLHDSGTIVYQHSGYESNTDRGWTVTMNFNFVHGTPARMPIGSKQLYRLNAPYGNVNNPFSAVVKPQTFDMPEGSDMVNFKIIQTGHGMDQQENCAEFCSKTRTVKLDGNTISEEKVWRDNCGLNSLYPQAGTWIYDRAGWCPGAPVETSDIFTSLQENSSHTFGIDMQDYTNTAGGSANYVLTTHAQFFKDMRKQYDAAIDDIISPSTHFEYLRDNPTCGAPVIRVKNMGKDTLKAIEFEYGRPEKLQTIWVPCNIAPFKTQALTLEAIYDWSGTGNTFMARITKVNNHADEYTDDNTMYSKITNSQTFPNKIIILFKSNSAPSENYYTLKDSRGNVIRNKNNFAANTIYRDTVLLNNNICYSFEFFDDGNPPVNNPLNRDGLDWWANPSDGTGYIQIRNGNNNSMLKNFTADFGTKQLIHFYTTFTMGTEELKEQTGIQIQVIPNPTANGSQTSVYVDIDQNEPYTLNVFDMNGRLITSNTGRELSAHYVLPVLSSGLYTVQIQQGFKLASSKFIVN